MQYQEQHIKKEKSMVKWVACAVIAIVLPIVAIFFIAILASIALPMYSQFKRRAYTVNVIKATHEIGKSLIDSYNEQGVFPEFEDTDSLGSLTNQSMLTDNLEYSMDQQGRLLQLRVTFVGLGYDGNHLDMVIDCSSGDCEKSMTFTGPHYEDFKLGDLDLDVAESEN